MKSQAKVVIIGGGVMGCGLAYHLCKEGWTDVLLVEKAELTSGSTWHAAGQVGHAVTNYNLAQMVHYAADFYPELEKETGHGCSWHGCGSLRMAYDKEEVDWLKYMYSLNKGLGHGIELVTPDEMKKLHPFYNTNGIELALYTPEDGHLDPAGAAFAMAKGAKMMGCEISKFNRVLGLEKKQNGEWIVRTEKGDITCEYVVNAGGTYARQIGQWVGLNLPMTSLLHHYIVTEPVPEFENLEKELPVIRDDRLVSGYIRMEQQSGLIGIYQKSSVPSIWDEGTPWDSEHELFEENFDIILPWLENSLERMPVLAERGFKRIVHGAISYPPDANMFLGPTEVENFWLCCGSQIGIAWAPGAGKYMAQWMVHGAADISMNMFDPRRFGALLDDDYRIKKAKEIYYHQHEIAYLDYDLKECRPSHSKTTPIYQDQKKNGAVFEDAYGWERPYWYAIGDEKAEHIHSFRRTRLFDIIKNEVHSLRNNVGLCDLSPFSKIEITGFHASQFLDRITSNTLPQKTGKIHLTYFVIPFGRIEGEATIMKLGENHYYLIYAANRLNAFIDWLKTQIQPSEFIQINDITEKYGVLLVAGPDSRELLKVASPNTALDNKDFRWLTGQHIQIGDVGGIRALRVSFTGELAWELHIPMSGMKSVYDILCKKGTTFNLSHFGSLSLNSMRLEKAYLGNHEITNEITLKEARLDYFVKEGDFQGKAQSCAESDKWELALLEIEEAKEVFADPLMSEGVFSGGKRVGTLTSGSYCYGIQKTLAFGYLQKVACAIGTECEISILGETRKAKVIELKAQWDSKNERIKK